MTSTRFFRCSTSIVIATFLWLGAPGCVSHHPQNAANAGKSHKTPLPADQVPDVVKQALNTRFPNITSTEWKLKPGNIYEAEFFVAAAEITVMFDSTGKWLETETAIDLATVPPIVRDAAARDFPGFKIIETQSVQRYDRSDLLYELHLANAKEIWKVLFDPQGEILSKSSKAKK